jgi:putative addiction module component (TIGR02574 family)
MPITMNEVFEEALSLSEESRILLAERLLESVPPDKGIFEAQLQVAARRADELEAGRVTGIPGSEALARVRESILRRSES